MNTFIFIFLLIWGVLGLLFSKIIWDYLENQISEPSNKAQICFIIFILGPLVWIFAVMYGMGYSVSKLCVWVYRKLG